MSIKQYILHEFSDNEYYYYYFMDYINYESLCSFYEKTYKTSIIYGFMDFLHYCKGHRWGNFNDDYAFAKKTISKRINKHAY